MIANKIGNKIVQQKVISWSNRILGNDALTQIKTNIRIQDLRPKDKLYTKPWNITIKIFKLTSV